MPDLAPLVPVSRIHLERLTGPLGIMQHAIGIQPDPAHGYCTDDVARALQVDLLHRRTLGWPAVTTSAQRSFRFLAEAFDDGTGRFRNFRAADGTWAGGPASEDSHGRAVLALGELIADAPDAILVAAATALFDRALPAALGLTALRAQASVLLGWVGRRHVEPGPANGPRFEQIAERYHDRFRGVAHDWPWPEAKLTYENALLPRALIVAGLETGSRTMLATGLRALDWLIEAQLEPDGHLAPIGNGWWSKGGVKARHDQQPIEATSLLQAAAAAFEATAEVRYRDVAESAYRWFLGGNDQGAQVANATEGSSGDGLTPRGVSSNRGAESTLMWLMAAEHIRTLRESAGRGPSLGRVPVAVAVG